MSPTASNIKQYLPLKNVARFASLAHTLMTPGLSDENVGIWYGYSGYGKTCARIYCENRIGAIAVDMRESWRKKDLLSGILAELGIQAGKMTIAAMAATIVARLAENPRPLIIDEADKLIDKNLIEQVREIVDLSHCPVILIGEERFPSRLSSIEHMHNRVRKIVAAEPCDAEDTAALAAAYCPQITISPDLLDDLRRASEGKARRVAKNLEGILEYARNHGLKTVDRKAWGLTAFATGRAPDPRKVATFSRVA